TIMKALADQGLLTKTQFDEEIEWTWYYLWHHEGRRARHGASMMAPDYAHLHGMFEVAERFYMELLPEARELLESASRSGKGAQARAVEAVIEGVLRRPEHAWYREISSEQADLIRKGMEERYGKVQSGGPGT
ncbi:MAG: hydroxylamine oxidoreductase, partial [Candidatus Eisenbacteria bacterium]